MLQQNKYFYRVTVLLIVLILLAMTVTPLSAAPEKRPVIVTKVTGTITPGQLNYLSRQIESAVRNEAQLLVIVVNTPGGLVNATLKINEAILNAPVPVAVLVAPSGGIAASAGAFIVLSADIAAMAPGTTIGAAHPVAVSPGGATPADEKTVNFLANHLRSLATEKGRPGDVAARFVTENLVLIAAEALEVGVIDYLAADLNALLTELDGVEIEKKGNTYTLFTAGAPQREENHNLREQLQNWLSNPEVSLILLLLGLMGIYFGLNAPGTFVPEIGGLILLLLGVYGFGLFDINTGGILILLLGIGLIIAEIFTAGFGILGIGGALCMVIGAILLPLEPLMAADWYNSFRSIVFGTVIAVTGITLLVVQRIVDSRRRHKEGGAFFRPPERGVVVEQLDPEGLIKARGELWKAVSDSGAVIAAGTKVEVVRAENLTLWVRPAAEQKNV